jgi:hypothetical protein
MPLSSHIKPEPNPPLTLPRVIRAREMYAEGFTVARILAHCEISLGTLYACLDGNPFADQGEPMPPVPRRRQVLKKRHRALKTDSVSLTNRLLRTAERQVREIETRLSAREQPPVERERDVRMLMNLTRALRDLQVLQKSPKAAEPAEPVEEDDGDPDRLPASIDALRRELSHKLAGMVASEEARKARED